MHSARRAALAGCIPDATSGASDKRTTNESGRPQIKIELQICARRYRYIAFWHSVEIHEAKFQPAADGALNVVAEAQFNWATRK